MRGYAKANKGNSRHMGRKITMDNIKVLGRKIHNTVRDIASYAAPIADGISIGAGFLGNPELSATAAGVGQIARSIK